MNGGWLAAAAVAAVAVVGRPRGSRALDPVIDEAYALARWFRPLANRWRHEDGDMEPIGLDDIGLTVPDRQDVLASHLGDRLLGSGIWRAVVASSNPRYVIKLAMRPGDNLDEAAAWQDAGPETKKMLVPVVAVDPDGHWLVMERVATFGFDDWQEQERVANATAKRAEDVGLFDVHSENVARDGRILDYGEPVSLRGTPNKTAWPTRILPTGTILYHGSNTLKRGVPRGPAWFALDAESAGDFGSRVASFRTTAPYTLAPVDSYERAGAHFRVPRTARDLSRTLATRVIAAGYGGYWYQHPYIASQEVVLGDTGFIERFA